MESGTQICKISRKNSQKTLEKLSERVIISKHENVLAIILNDNELCDATTVGYKTEIVAITMARKTGPIHYACGHTTGFLGWSRSI